MLAASSHTKDIYIIESTLPAVTAGQHYTAFQKSNKWFIYNNLAQPIALKRSTIKWKKMDTTVLIVQLTKSVLSTVEVGEIYRVFNDEKNDERYIFDKNRKKVLFDSNIFSYKVL